MLVVVLPTAAQTVRTHVLPKLLSKPKYQFSREYFRPAVNGLLVVQL